VLGEGLRELRLRQGMTLRELATEAQVSPALLSQLENGITDPSLSTLRKPAAVFKTEVSALFNEPNAPMVHLSRPGQRMRLTAPLGEITYERLTPGRRDLEVLMATMESGDVSSPERRGHESTECIVVLGRRSHRRDRSGAARPRGGRSADLRLAPAASLLRRKPRAGGLPACGDAAGAVMCRFPPPGLGASR
jgi:transcriptional regulator with XRE-family HTH domain